MNQSKIFKAMLIVLAVVGLAISLSGCTPGSEASISEYRTATVGRGDISIDITAAGNLSYALEEDLAFGAAGWVEEILVEEGDEISEGQVLATLDTSDLERAVTEAEAAVKQAELSVEQAQLSVEQAQLDKRQAEANWKQAKEDLRELKRKGFLSSAQRRIAELKIEAAELNIKAAELNIKAVGLKIETTNSQLVSAEEAVVEAQEELDGAVIIAPFDGFVTSVNVEGGDEVSKGTVAVQVVDPERFKTEILVGEMDIFEIKLQNEALVEVDSLTMLSIPAEVSYISPIATIQSGVVTYKVEVELESLETLKQEMLEAMQERQEAMQEAASGEMPEQLKQAIEQGLISQEEAEETMKAAQQRQGQAGLMQEQQEAMMAMLEGLQLKEGLNVTVSIIVDKASDVLLVPNQAIIYQGMRAYVQVLSDGVIEERLIQTGINDWQYTEVISGLTEGEEVVIPQTTTTTPTTQQRQPPGGIVPGMPRMLR